MISHNREQRRSGLQLASEKLYHSLLLYLCTSSSNRTILFGFQADVRHGNLVVFVDVQVDGGDSDSDPLFISPSFGRAIPST
jgi:hypothetical protein